MFSGIFAPLSKITKPVPGALFKLPPPKPQTVTYGKVDVSKVTSRIDTGQSTANIGHSKRVIGFVLGMEYLEKVWN